MIKRILLLCFLSLFLNSCEDFTGKNLDLVENKTDSPFVLIDQLLANPSTINTGSYSMEKQIANTSLLVVSPLITKLGDSIESLSQGMKQHCHNIDALPSLTNKTLEKMKQPLREKWIEANGIFHQLELMNFGPAADPNSTSYHSLYSFDGEIKCRIDLSLIQLRSRGRLPRMDVISNYNVRGLDALEPILFAGPDQSRCKRVTPRIREWLDSPLLEKEKLNCKFSQHLLSDMVKKAKDLEKEWSPNEGNFSLKILQGKLGTNVQAINKISQALFLLDTEIKDRRLSYPAGFDVRINEVITKCPTSTCPENIEALYSNQSLQNLINSLEGFKLLFTGGDGFGFDDLLVDRGHGEIAKSLVEALESALKNFKEQSKITTLKELLKDYDLEKCAQTTSSNREVEVCALVQDIRQITNLLKNEYLLALQELSAPRGAQGDND